MTIRLPQSSRGRPKLKEADLRARIDLTLSPSAIDKAKKDSEKLGMTFSRYIEYLIRTAKEV